MIAAPPIAAVQTPEIRNFEIDVPPNATLWGVIVFMADESLEVTLARGNSRKSYQGRFQGQRFAEHEWRNTGTRPERVLIRAKALAGERELPPTRVEFLSHENVYVGFGRRATPADSSQRRGGYPFDVRGVRAFAGGEPWPPVAGMAPPPLEDAQVVACHCR